MEKNIQKTEPVRFTLRLEKEIFEAVKASALRNRRATGKEIEYVLFEYYKKLKLL